MKRIIFVRHARAEEDTGAFPDFERSLTSGGKTTSAKMAALLREKVKNKPLFISSPAFRAFETAVIFARIMKYGTDDIIFRRSLYDEPDLFTLGEILSEIGETVDTVILFGHNPSFTGLADRLSKDGCDFIPKTGIVCLSFHHESWKGLVRERGTIEYFLKPDKSS